MHNGRKKEAGKGGRGRVRVRVRGQFCVDGRSRRHRFLVVGVF